MSIGSASSLTSSTPFQFDGVVSGLSTSSIISKLMSLERGPLNQLQQQQATIQSRDTAYANIKSQVASFQTALQTLLQQSNVNVKAALSTTANVATATATSDASNGNYQLSVTRLATSSTVSSGIWNAGTSSWTAAPIGAGLDSGAGTTTSFKNAGFAIPPTAGTFTINGKTVDISDSVDPGNPHTLDWVMQQINSSVPSVTASITTDANGNKNGIVLHSLDGNPIQLGSGADTSNFLGAAHLVATGATGDVASSVPLGTVNPTATLGNAHLGTVLSGTGSFTINGQTITWDASQDTLNTVLNKINSSSAGVTASYDPTKDTLSITNTATGNQSISLTNDNGGFLAAMHVLGTSQQTMGATAQFSVNGGPSQYSNSNNVSGLVTGVTFNLAGTGATTVSVNQDTSTTVKNVQNFANAYNSLVDLIDQNTAYNSNTKKAAVLTGDSGIQGFEAQIREMLTSAVSGLQGTYTSLGSIGISTGAFGSAVGTTNHLTVDTTKLTTALQSDPASVYRVLSGDSTTVLNPDSNGKARAGSWISGLTGTPAAGTYGSYKITVDASGNLSSVFTPGGQAALSPILGTITPPPPVSTNSSLIPGLTLSTSALPSSGSQTDTVWFGQPGILGRLNDMLNTGLGPGGVFDNEHTSATSQLQDIGSQIDNTNQQLQQRQQVLQQQFTAMETALAQINAQGGNMLAQMGVSSSSSSSSQSSSSNR
jgi:flagellar hook-associated protein 2